MSQSPPPSSPASGSTIVAELLDQAREYALTVRVQTEVDSVSARLALQKLEAMIRYHFGGTEPFATLHVDGSFIHTEFHSDKPNEGHIPLFRAPQFAAEPSERLQKLEAFWSAHKTYKDEDDKGNAEFERSLSKLQTLREKIAAARKALEA